MNDRTRRKFLLCSAVGVAASLGMLPPTTTAQENADTQEVSGRILREQIEERVQPFFQVLENERGEPLSDAEKQEIVHRIWITTKAELEDGGVYVVLDP